MSFQVEVNKSLSLEEQYALIVKQIKSLLSKDDKQLSNLANLTAVLFNSFDKISWAGFYLFDGEKLFLGPFQGKTACTQIEMGKGVCGTAAQKQSTIIVDDVAKFPGHIYCDPDSKSEIVLPVYSNGNLFGVLDLDSNQLAAFNEIDKKYLEEICTFLSENILVEE